MTHRPILLIDESKVPVARLDVAPVDGRFEGNISLETTPPRLRALFEEFEEIVEGQVFSLLDDIEARLRAESLQVVFDDGDTAAVSDLQVFPSTHAVSFKSARSGLPAIAETISTEVWAFLDAERGS